MTSHALPSFWQSYRQLPKDVRISAQKAFRLFQADSTHRSLHFKQLQGYPGIWSARVTISYRAVARRNGDDIYWIWIGSHADYDRMF